MDNVNKIYFWPPKDLFQVDTRENSTYVCTHDDGKILPCVIAYKAI